MCGDCSAATAKKFLRLPGSPVAKTSPSNEQGGWIPGQGAKVHMPQGQKTKTCKNRSNDGQTQQRLLDMPTSKKEEKSSQSSNRGSRFALH